MKIKNLTYLKNKKIILIGETKINCDKSLYPYLYGFRKNIGIINIEDYILNLKKIKKLILILLKYNLKVIFFNFPSVLNKKWNFIEKLSKYNFIFTNDLTHMNKYNNIGLILVYQKSFKINKDFKKLKKESIPVIGFFQIKIELFDYYIAINNKSLNTALFFYNFLLNILNKYK